MKTISPPQRFCPYCGDPVRPEVATCFTCGQVLKAWSIYQDSKDHAAVRTRPGPVVAVQRRGAKGPVYPGRLVTAPRSPQRTSRLAFLLSVFLVLLLLLLGFGLIAVLAHQQAMTIPQRQAQATPATSQATPLPRPTPAIMLASLYHVGENPAGATGTTLQISGDHFAPHVGMAFLLDGEPAPGSQVVQSDDAGQAQADVVITAGWSIGTHVLSAQEATDPDHLSSNGVTLVVVAQGQAGTPGPNGAPPDGMSFVLSLTVSPIDTSTKATLPSFYDTLTVLGRPDPKGGLVCDEQHDTGQPIETKSRGGGLSYVVTYVATCSGTYKGGRLSYTETATSFQLVYASGLTCQAQVPVVLQSLEGSFLDGTTVNGSFRADALDFTCSNGQSSTNAPQTGAWSGTITG